MSSQRPLQVVADPYVTACRYLSYTVSGYIVDSNGNQINFNSTSISTGYDGYTKFWAYLTGILRLSDDRTAVKLAFVVNNREAVSFINFNLPLKAGYHMFVVKTEITGQTAYTTL
jgi:hypothetical protein